MTKVTINMACSFSSFDTSGCNKVHSRLLYTTVFIYLFMILLLFINLEDSQRDAFDVFAKPLFSFWQESNICHCVPKVKLMSQKLSAVGKYFYSVTNHN